MQRLLVNCITIIEIKRTLTLSPYFLCQAYISVHHRGIPKCCLQSPSWSKGSVDVKIYPLHAVGIRLYVQVISILSLQCCRLSVPQWMVTFHATFYLSKYVPVQPYFPLDFLHLVFIWPWAAVQGVYIYILLLVSSLLRCLSAEYLLNMTFIWIHFIFNLTSGLHDGAPLSASWCLEL